MFKKLIICAMVVMSFFAMKAATANAYYLGPIPVANGSFATGDFTGWTISGNTGATSWYFVNNDGLSLSPAAPSATYAQFGSTGFPTFISQNLSTTPGQLYSVSFWVANDAPASMGFNQFLVLWNGTIEAPSIENGNAFDWTRYTYTAMATGTSTPISFSFQNEASVFDFTKVTAAAVPLPAALWFFGSGLIGLAGLRKRMQTSKR